MSTIEIRHRYTDAVLFECEAPDIKSAVEAAMKRGVDLRDINLRDVNMSGVDLRDAKEDFYQIINLTPNEVPGLRAALVDARIDGSTYHGDCCCLVGTVANLRGCKYDSIAGVKPDVDRPAERLFMAIRKDDTPETNRVSAIVVGWIDEWRTLRAETDPTYP